MPTDPGTYIFHNNEYVKLTQAFDKEAFELINDLAETSYHAGDFIMNLSQACGKQVLHIWKDNPHVAIETCNPIKSDMMTVMKVRRDTGMPIKTTIYGKYLDDNYQPSLTPNLLSSHEETNTDDFQLKQLES